MLAGVAAGLAFSTKYSFAIGLVLPLVAWRSIWRRATSASHPPQPLSRSRERGEGSLVLLAEGAGEELRAAVGSMLSWRSCWRASWSGAVLGRPGDRAEPGPRRGWYGEQARLGGIRWNGQSDAPIWQLYVRDAGKGLGWPALVLAGRRRHLLWWRNREALVAVLAVLAACLAVMLRQQLFSRGSRCRCCHHWRCWPAGRWRCSAGHRGARASASARDGTRGGRRCC